MKYLSQIYSFASNILVGKSWKFLPKRTLIERPFPSKLFKTSATSCQEPIASFCEQTLYISSSSLSFSNLWKFITRHSLHPNLFHNHFIFFYRNPETIIFAIEDFKNAHNIVFITAIFVYLCKCHARQIDFNVF